MKDIPYELIARYLAGECNDEEKQQVQEWSRQHPDEMAGLTGIWQQTPDSTFNPDVEQALQKVHGRMDSKKMRRARRILMIVSSAAAVVLLLSIIGIRNWKTSGDEPPVPLLLAIQTGAGETGEYILPDGSRVWLNRSSSVRYPGTFAGDMREVYLEGEAFFDITPNAGQPFIIHANHTQTRVVGTSFGIRAIKGMDEVIVTVSTGVVNLSAEGEAGQIEIRQGEQGVCNPEQQKLEHHTDPDPNSLAWKTRLLVFKQTPLSQVVQVIENTYHTRILADSSVAGLSLTSTFDQLSLDEVLQIIGITLQVQVETKGEEILLTR